MSYIFLVTNDIVELKRASYSKVKILLCLKELYNPFPMNYQLSVIFPTGKRIEQCMHQMSKKTQRKYTGIIKATWRNLLSINFDNMKSFVLLRMLIIDVSR